MKHLKKLFLLLTAVVTLGAASCAQLDALKGSFGSLNPLSSSQSSEESDEQSLADVSTDSESEISTDSETQSDISEEISSEIPEQSDDSSESVTSSSTESSTPEEDSSEDSSSDIISGPDTPAPESPFDGIEFSDAATVIPMAYALDQGKALDGTYTLKGQIIASDGYNNQYGDISVTIAVEGFEEYPLYCYQIKNDADKIGLGDYIAVQGTIKNYKGTIEFDRPTMLAYEAGQLAPSIDVTPSAGTGIAEGYQVITVEQAIAIAEVQENGATAERYYICATVETVTKAQYGAMVISDATGSISVYGTYSADGSIGYAAMADKPTKGDTVLLHCTLNNYKGSPEIQNARLIDFEKVQLDLEAYTEMNIADARVAQAGDKIKVDGVVAQITYANGMIPNGIYLVDETASIYVFDTDLAGQVAEGNTITILAEKTWWILDTEVQSAEKFGYKGCNQLADAWLLENDGEVSEPDYSWVTETTVKDIMDTPFTTDITTDIYKVTAVVKKLEGTGFINYYIDDLDGKTGSYVYTQCNGSDLDWLEPFDGKICTVYLSVINAKSTNTGCVWRFKALKVIDEGYTFDMENAPQFALDYYAVDQFEASYTSDPAQEMLTTVDSELLGFSGVTLSYESDNTDVIYFDNNVMHCGTAFGVANVTVTASYNGLTAAATVAVEYAEAEAIDYITVAEAIAAVDEEIITVRGIVGPSLVNQAGFYLFSEDGDMIAVKLLSKDLFEGLSVGNDVILQGKRERQMKDESATTYFGQTCIEDAEILVNNKGNHEYSTAKFITDKTIADVTALSILEDHTTSVYVLTGTLTFPGGYGQVSIKDANGNKIGFYASSSSQYSYLEEYNGQEVVLEIAVCNWNGKTYWTGCAIAIRLADGTKIVNTLNFNS